MSDILVMPKKQIGFSKSAQTNEQQPNKEQQINKQIDTDTLLYSHSAGNTQTKRKSVGMSYYFL